MDRWSRYKSSHRAVELGITAAHQISSHRSLGSDKAPTQDFCAVATFFLLRILVSWCLPGRLQDGMSAKAKAVLAASCIVAMLAAFTIKLSVAPGERPVAIPVGNWLADLDPLHQSCLKRHLVKWGEEGLEIVAQSCDFYM